MKRSAQAISPEIMQAANLFIEQAQNDTEGKTAIHFAASKGNIPALDYLIQIGHNVHQKDNNERTAAHYAAKNGQDEMINHLATVHKLVLNQTENSRYTPLRFAVEEGHDSTIQLLLDEYGFNPREKDKGANTLFHIAVNAGRYSTVRLLLTKYSHLLYPFEQNKYGGNTPLQLAAQKGLDDIVRLFIDAEYNYTANSLKQNGAGNTALHLAAQAGHNSTVRLLITEYKDLLNLAEKNEDGKTALDCAFKNGHHKICEELLLKCPELRMEGIGKTLWESLWESFKKNIALMHIFADYQEKHGSLIPSDVVAKIASFAHEEDGHKKCLVRLHKQKVTALSNPSYQLPFQAIDPIFNFLPLHDKQYSSLHLANKTFFSIWERKAKYQLASTMPALKNEEIEARYNRSFVKQQAEIQYLMEDSQEIQENRSLRAFGSLYLKPINLALSKLQVLLKDETTKGYLIKEKCLDTINKMIVERKSEGESGALDYRNLHLTRLPPSVIPSNIKSLILTQNNFNELSKDLPENILRRKNGSKINKVQCLALQKKPLTALANTLLTIGNKEELTGKEGLTYLSFENDTLKQNAIAILQNAGMKAGEGEDYRVSGMAHYLQIQNELEETVLALLEKKQAYRLK